MWKSPEGASGSSPVGRKSAIARLQKRAVSMSRHQHELAFAHVVDDDLHFRAAVLAIHLKNSRILHDLQLKTEGARENRHNVIETHDCILRISPAILTGMVCIIPFCFVAEWKFPTFPKKYSCVAIITYKSLSDMRFCTAPRQTKKGKCEMNTSGVLFRRLDAGGEELDEFDAVDAERGESR